MKKLLFLIASFIVGIICSVGLTGPQTPAHVPEKINEHVIVSSEHATQRISSAPANKDSQANAATNRLTANAIQLPDVEIVQK